MDTVTYPQETVQAVLAQLTIAAKINVLEDRETSKRFGAHWTPRFYVLRPGTEVPIRMWSGWLAPESFAAELSLGALEMALSEKRISDALGLAETVLAGPADLERRAEARYWKAVATYKSTGKIDDLNAGLAEVKSGFPGTAAARRLLYGAPPALV
jgi:hypothetical protein